MYMKVDEDVEIHLLWYFMVEMKGTETHGYYMISQSIKLEILTLYFVEKKRNKWSDFSVRSVPACYVVWVF